MERYFCLSLFLFSQTLSGTAFEVLDCSVLDNGQTSDNPVYREPSCSYPCEVIAEIWKIVKCSNSYHYFFGLRQCNIDLCLNI